MKGKKSKINLKKGFQNTMNMIKKADKKKLNRVCIVILVIAVIIAALSLLSSPVKYNKDMNKVREWLVSDNYDLGQAMDNALTHAKWKEKDNIITVTGKDRKTKDKVVIKFKMGEYMSFDSMTINDQPKEYSEWFDYLLSYKK